MEFDVLRTLLVPEVLILIPVLYFIGVFVRQIPNVPDWIDVWIKLLVGMVASMFIVGFNVDGFIQGVLVTGGASLIKDVVNRTTEAYDESKLPKGVERDPDSGQFKSKDEE